MAQAQQVLISELSFGYEGRINQGDSRGQIPNFALQGSSYGQPQLLSNKVILTPVAPGNQRASIWSEKTLDEPAWVADVDLRATGPERGGGNFNIWLARDGKASVGDKSIYTVGKFEGLALVIDAHGGSGGMLRGFLNDGSVDFGARSSVDELAFGHCAYSYRNLGRPSQVKLSQSRDMFRVEIDGRLCFQSDKVSLPRGYNVGLTAATPDNPDSFEVFKLVVLSDRSGGGSSSNDNSYGYANPAAKSETRSRIQQQPPKRNYNDGGNDSNQGGRNDDSNEDGDDSFDDVIDQDPDIFQTSKLQFQDLHNRLQSTHHQLSSVYRSVSRHHQLDEQRHAELKTLISNLGADVASIRSDVAAKMERVEALDQRFQKLEGEVRGVRNDVSRKIRDNERAFKGYLSDHHATLSQTLLDSMPSHRKLFALFVVAQVVLVGAYLFYKYRKANSPKKYL
ncbi:lectin, mannose-binding 1 [Geosmithia morbida]|uniref:Lectin, mannose-binding 1 n=1 Tax=Geosmithia morbida TaxID=1094350 RepID=A0A9P4YQQ8_9HYPO|nr:lectin, mannose-binding 1 [Geosmithia morbida]KAF4120310.1 lectin, mannose-binding 1 [Geosmithia morbida]